MDGMPAKPGKAAKGRESPVRAPVDDARAPAPARAQARSGARGKADKPPGRKPEAGKAGRGGKGRRSRG
jgi:hypothetical protein